MKIGILTLHWSGNFGANLQAYATSSYLSGLGHEVFFINFRATAAEEYYTRMVPTVQLNAHKRFVEKHLCQTPLARNLDDVYGIIKESAPDCLITGSDAVFRLRRNAPRIDQVFPNPFWLPFLRNTEDGRPMKVALSPSAMGCRFDVLPQSVRDGINQSISDMDYVSVRDEWTAKQLKKTGVQRLIPILPDPVFLLRNEIARRKRALPNRDPYILISTERTMPGGWTAAFTKLANKKGLEVISLPQGRPDTAVNRSIELPLDPLEWMDWIASASGYVGTRFHPIVVSLISNVPFFSIDRYHRVFWEASKSKTVNLLRNYNLHDNACSQLGQRFLSPRRVLNRLDTQKKMSGEINDISAKLENSLQDFLAGVFVQKKCS